MQLIVRVVVRLIRSGAGDRGILEEYRCHGHRYGDLGAAHLIQIAAWAVAFLLTGQVSTLEAALYLSAQSYTALGYGDVPLSVGSRLLGPLEAISGLLFFGLSTAVLFADTSQLIAHRLRTETGYQAGAAGKLTHLSAAGDPSSDPFDTPGKTNL